MGNSGFIGILFLLSRSLSETQQNIFGQPLGNILICFSTIGNSCYILYSRKILHENDNAAIQTTFLTYVFSTICSFLILCLGIAFKGTVLKQIPASGKYGLF